MKSLDLDYLKAFADVYQLNEKPFVTVIYLSGVEKASPTYKDLFVKKYKEVIKYGLIEDIRYEIQNNELNFFEACQEWDL